ncbi:phospho-sugar mutase [Agathobaculum sp. M2]|uniref:Phosphoglucomutase n=2 Tax=Agathobaculum hominis TaxID=2763014 RepID=A0ABR7GQQ7_9FIRM|nr:phospho-sugar mutase [Agathobaculum hominis]MBC5696642.1 phospho-sugar mutase [Agathobaculum hominis]
MNCMDSYQLWIEKTAGEAELAEELTAINGDSAAIEDRFYKELEFGTGGLRGVLGAGTNRMNVFTVSKATQGYSNYLNQQFEKPSVAIGYDSRIHSDDFARAAAAVFAANGIQVHIYDHLMPTPALSFAVRDLHCSGGIVLTASHNPAKYNGYKVYGADGCQITTEAAKAIQTAINEVDPFDDVKRTDFELAMENGIINYIGEDTIDRYQAAVSTASLLPEGIDKNVAIVYTPLNGAGISCVPRCLKEHGFTNITIPDEQKNPDGHFPTCPYPNPEVREALKVGLRWAEKTQSDLLLATDPDCDRVGAAVKTTSGYTLISGNQMGVLLFDFVCKMRQANGTMPKNPVAVKTIVTTPMAAKIAEHYGVQLIDVLTGFKFIGEQIGLLEKKGEADRYIFGFEESYGYLSGSFVRDKDAVNASLLICEMFAWYKSQGKSLVDVLEELYQEYGCYESKLLSFQFEGADGFAKMQSLMTELRTNRPAELAGIAVECSIDYLNDDTGLPKSNVLRFFLKNGAEAVVRPSGTEPKLKVYLTAAEKDITASQIVIHTLKEFFEQWAR